MHIGAGSLGVGRHGADGNAARRCALAIAARRRVAVARASGVLGVARARAACRRCRSTRTRASPAQGSEPVECRDATCARSRSRTTRRATRARCDARTPARSPNDWASRPESFTRPGALARALRRRGVSTDVALDAERFLRQLDEAAFSASGSLPADAAQRAAQLYRKRRWRGAGRVRRSPVCRRSCIVGSARGRRRDGARVSTRRRRVVRSTTASRRTSVTTSSRRARRSSPRSRPSRARRTRGPISARRRGPSPTRRAASPPGSVRFASSRSRPTCAIASSSCTRSRGRRPATCRRFAARGCSISPALLWCGAWGLRRVPRDARAPARPSRAWRRSRVVAAVLAIGGFALADRLSGRHLGVMRHTASLQHRSAARRRARRDGDHRRSRARDGPPGRVEPRSSRRRPRRLDRERGARVARRARRRSRFASTRRSTRD